MLSFAPVSSLALRPRSPAAAVLRASSLVLARLARRLEARAWTAHRSARSGPEPLFEFHAESGAPEGALFVDGRLIGHLPTQRL